MIGSFSSYEVGRRGLSAYRRALDIVGHNVANANTKGYSRQRIQLQASTPYTAPSAVRPHGAGQVGTGVVVQQIQRFRDAFLDRQFRYEAAELGKWGTRDTVLKEIETMLAEPGEAGLNAQLSKFFQAWAGAANAPDEDGPRNHLIQTAIGLTDSFQRLHRQLEDIRHNLAVTAENTVAEINRMASEIADLNRQIARAQGMGDQANDLRDRRDLLLDTLAGYAGISVQEDSLGAVKVYIEGHAIVDQFATNRLEAGFDSNGALEYRFPDLQDSTGSPLVVQPTSGELHAYQTMRDGAEPSAASLQQRLTELAYQLAKEINDVHRQGARLDGTVHGDADWLDFFADVDGFGPGNPFTLLDFKVNVTKASDIALARAADPSDPLYDPTKYPAAYRGDGEIGLRIAELASEPIMGGATFADFYRGTLNRFGVASEDSQRMMNNQQALLQLIENQRQAVSAVDIDEEMVNALLFQQSYNAAARFITVIDEMIDRLVNYTGVVGR